MYSLIADGQYRATSLGRDTWKLLIGSEASLQLSCNKEGFNAAVSDSPDNSKLKPESVSLVTTKTIAELVTLELDLVLEDILIIAARVETRLSGLQIMAKSILRQWDIFWCSKKKLIWVYLPWRQKKASLTEL